MDGFTPNKNEETFDVKPIGVRYRCEFCNIGEQKLVTGKPVVLEAVGSFPKLREHKCTHCGKIMMLPKAYPYIEWIEV